MTEWPNGKDRRKEEIKKKIAGNKQQ